MDKKIVSIKGSDESHEVVKNLIGKKFFAVSIDENGVYQHHYNKMNDQEIVYMLTMAINTIINE